MTRSTPTADSVGMAARSLNHPLSAAPHSASRRRPSIDTTRMWQPLPFELHARLKTDTKIPFLEPHSVNSHAISSHTQHISRHRHSNRANANRISSANDWNFSLHCGAGDGEAQATKARKNNSVFPSIGSHLVANISRHRHTAMCREFSIKYRRAK